MSEDPLEFRTVRVPGGERRLLFINGFGGNFEQPGVKWYMNRIKDHGLDATYVQLPTDITDLREDLLKPCRKVQEELGEHVLIGFSLGGLTASFMSGALKRIFVSPFWGVNERWLHPGAEHLVHLLSVIRKPILPRQFDVEDAGEMAVEKDMKGIPDRVSMKTIDVFLQTQKEIPPPVEGDVAFYSPDDKIISTNKVEERGIETHSYRGGHMFYLTRGRKDIMKDILAQVDKGFL